MTPISHIVTTHDQCDALRHLLPQLLEQDYPAAFEVIVADMNSTDDTLPFLESLGEQYSNLRTISLPESIRNISPVRLALTLGFRAASYDWVAVTQANCLPASSKWLSCMGQACSEREDIQMVLGYTRFVNGQGWHGLRCRFFRIWQQLLHLSWAEQNGAYRCDGTNLCYRRDLFLEHKGFADDANLRMGATDIMVNRNSTRYNTAVCLQPEAFMTQETPHYRRWWYQERLFFMETRHHFHNTVAYRLHYAWQNLIIWVPTLLALTGIVFGFASGYEYVSFISLIIWAVIMGFRCHRFNLQLKSIGEAPIIMSYPLLIHLILWWDILAWLRWLLTPKQVFRKKFI